MLPDGQNRELAVGATGGRPGGVAGAAGIQGRADRRGRRGGAGPGPAAARRRVGVRWCSPSSDEGLEVLRHSTAHVLGPGSAAAVPRAPRSRSGPPITDGFYLRLRPGRRRRRAAPHLLRRRSRRHRGRDAGHRGGPPAVHSAPRWIVLPPTSCSRRIPTRSRSSTARPTTPASGPEGGVITTYRNTDEFVDLCRGPACAPHRSAGPLQADAGGGRVLAGATRAVRCSSASTALRGGSNARPGRAPGTAGRGRQAGPPSAGHRAGPAELPPPSWAAGWRCGTPKGAVIRKLMEDYSPRPPRDRRLPVRLHTPHLANAQLFETSGHLDFYADGMYPPMEMDNGVYYPKPMNCPMHCLIFSQRQRSYRELPLRLFELGTVYRYERSGTLHGLMRIRGFTQDDSPPLRGRRAAQRRDRALAGLRAVGAERVRLHRLHVQTCPHQGPPTSSWAPTTAGSGPPPRCGRALDRRGHDYMVSEGEAAF